MNDIKRLLGIGQGALADKEREAAKSAVAKPTASPARQLISVMGSWYVRESGGMRPATASEIMQSGVCVTIMDNDDD